MKNKNEKPKSIIIETTPELDNWLHPQTEERKQRIRDKADITKRRFEEMRIKNIGGDRY